MINEQVEGKWVNEGRNKGNVKGGKGVMKGGSEGKTNNGKK